jgi:muramoyltetrapeptide carboxypeptidase
MTIPSYLRTGDTVALVAPAGQIEPAQIASAIRIIELWGLKVVLGKNIYSKHFNFSGTDKQRAEDLQEALDNPKIKAVFCARGGYGALRIIDKIDWTSFIKKPKWVIGYSDITALHSAINNTLQVASIHGPMPVNFEKLQEEKQSLDYLKKLLFGESLTISIPNTYKTIPSEINGNIIGGNLSLLYSLRGTPYDFKSENNILFIEEIGEYMYHIDRMIHNFKLGNKFAGLKAIILGGFTGITDNDIPFGLTIEEIVTDALKGNSIPVINNFPAGHLTPNYPLILVSEIKINIEKEKIEFSY